jgi:hypothetical protein
MLRNVEIHDFRCLRNVTVPLRPLTVLIGPNDSGKSAFLAAIEHLIAIPPNFADGDHWRNDTDNTIHLIGTTDRGQLSCIAQHSHGKQTDPSSQQLRASLLPVARFQLPASGVPMQCSGFSPSEEGELAVGLDGSRTAALLDYLLRRDRKRFDKINDVLRTYIRGLEDVIIGTPDTGTRRVDLVIEGGFQLPADRASAGVRLLLFFVALAYHPRPPRTILIEEPETGLHPKRLASAMQLMGDLTTGKHGKHPAQIILTTHSPYLLDSVDLGQDQVLVFRRNDDGSRSAMPVDQERLKTFLDEFMLGEIWFNEEESGLVAKS